MPRTKLTLFGFVAQCVTLYVGPGGTNPTCSSVGSPCGTIGAAVALANPSDSMNTIYVAAGSYSSTGNFNLVVSGTVNISIIGAGQGVSILDLEQAGASPKPSRLARPSSAPAGRASSSLPNLTQISFLRPSCVFS